MMRESVLKGLSVACLALGMTHLAIAKEEISIATVDMQKALQSVESGKRARSQLESEFNKKKNQLQTEESAIKKMTEEFKKQSLVMSDEARAKKQGELQERIMKFQEVTARSQAEIQQKERDLTAPIVTKLRTLIADMAKKKSYSLVLEKNENTVLYSLEKDDLTSEIISAFDKQTKSEKAQVDAVPAQQVDTPSQKVAQAS